MTKSGLADSPFFAPPPIAPSQAKAPLVEKYSPEKTTDQDKSSDEINPDKTVRPQHHATMTPHNRDTVVSSNRGITVSSNHETMIEVVRKAVKELGKEAATHRFTVEEKRAVLDLVYTYKGSGIRTSENEIARIAINYALEDYKQNGRNSILDKVLRALNE